MTQRALSTCSDKAFWAWNRACHFLSWLACVSLIGFPDALCPTGLKSPLCCTVSSLQLLFVIREALRLAAAVLCWSYFTIIARSHANRIEPWGYTERVVIVSIWTPNSCPIPTWSAALQFSMCPFVHFSPTTKIIKNTCYIKHYQFKCKNQLERDHTLLLHLLCDSSWLHETCALNCRRVSATLSTLNIEVMLFNLKC